MHPNPLTTPLPHLDYRWVFGASLLLSAWLIMLDPLIYRDAIIYLRAADAYLQQGFAASQQEFGRPLLSVCMALLHQWTGMPIQWAGQLLVTLSYALMCTGFVATVHTLGGDRRVQILAAVVVLSHPMLNNNRSSIMRDPIFWSLLIMAFRELLLYLRQPGLKHQLRGFIYIFIASLFRFEGLFFAVLAPLSLLFTRNLPGRLRHCLRLLVPQLVAVGGLLLAVLVYQSQLSEDSRLFPIINMYIDRLLAFPGEFAQVAAATAEPMLNFTAREDAQIAVLAGFAAILLVNLCRAMTWPWLITLLWGWRAHLLDRLRPDDATVLRSHILISLIYLVLFLLANRFMLERYGNQLVIFALLYIPFILSNLWGAGGKRKYLVIALLVLMSADSIHNGERDKLFVREATDWVRLNTPEHSSLVTNEKYIAYFSKRDFDWKTALSKEFQLEALLAQPKHWRNKDYLVIYVKRREAQRWNEFLAQHKLQEIQSFQGSSEKKGRVAVVALRSRG